MEQWREDEGMKIYEEGGEDLQEITTQYKEGRREECHKFLGMNNDVKITY